MLRKCVDRCFISANFIAIISILTVLFCTFTLLLTQVDDQVNSNNNSRSDKNIYPNLTISLSWSVPAIPTSTIFSTNTFIIVTTTATASSTTALKSSLLSSTILTTIPYRSTISTPSPTPQTRQSILIDNEEVLIPIAAATTFKTSKWLLDIPDIVVCKIVSTTSSSSDLSFVNFSSNPLAVKPYLQSQIKLETITNYVENKMESSDSTCNTFQLLSEGKLQGHLQVQCSKSCDTTLDNCIWRTLQWSMPNCNWISYVKDSFKLFECLVSPKKTTWIFVGDSTLRGIFSRILDLLGYSIPPLAFHGSFQLLTRQLTAFFEFWPHWNNEEENTAEYFEEFLLLFLQRIERVQGYNNTNNNDNNNNDNSSSSSSSSSSNNNNTNNNNNNNNSNEDLRKIPVFHASRKIVFVFFGITATVELVASVHKVLQYFFKANFANIIIVIKSKGVAYNPEWVRSTLAQLSPVYQETQKHNFFYFDSFTTSHPVWFLFPKDTCFCHGYRQVISGKPGSRIIGEVNDIWVEELLNGVCPMLN